MLFSSSWGTFKIKIISSAQQDASHFGFNVDFCLFIFLSQAMNFQIGFMIYCDLHQTRSILPEMFYIVMYHNSYGLHLEIYPIQTIF